MRSLVRRSAYASTMILQSVFHATLTLREPWRGMARRLRTPSVQSGRDFWRRAALVIVLVVRSMCL